MACRRSYYSADIYSMKMNVIVEADGPNHFSSQAGAKGKVHLLPGSNVRGNVHDRGWNRLKDTSLKDQNGEQGKCMGKCM